MFVRPLSAAEREALQQGLKSPASFVLRRSQILLASASGQGPAAVGRSVGCTPQAVRDVIRAFGADGLGCLTAKSKARKNPANAWSRTRDDDLKELLHRSPRDFGKPTSLWTLALVAGVCHQKGWTARPVSGEAIRLILKRLGVGWKRAKHWITSPDPQYVKKKGPGTG